jgi:hypothetical protein
MWFADYKDSEGEFYNETLEGLVENIADYHIEYDESFRGLDRIYFTLNDDKQRNISARALDQMDDVISAYIKEGKSNIEADTAHNVIWGNFYNKER